MNEKASVSKELHAKHTKILEGLLKLPENRECADCPTRAPRWASVNLGIFICMQCSGIHRSLGVHISKVRSVTLDTWLPEQISFMQTMGNVKSNKYWEAEIPQNLERDGTEKFIRTKYEEKRWISRDIVQPAQLLNEHSVNSNNLGDINKIGIPKKTRKLSLDEGIFLKHMAQVVPPTTRHRGCSLDMNSKDHSPAPSGHGTLLVKKDGASTDLFDLLYSQDTKPDQSTVSQSWATFD